MPRLDDVTQNFTADTAPYIEAVTLAAQAAREFAAANAEALANLRALQAAMRDMNGSAGSAAVAIRGVASAEDEARNSAALLEQILSELRNQTVILGAGFTFLDDKLASVSAYAAAAASSLSDLRVSMYATAFASAAAAAGIAKIGDATAAAPARAGLAIGAFRLTGATIHWLISGTAELLAIVLPAAVAAAAGAFVLYQGVVENVGRQLTSIQTVTEATGAVFHKTAGDILIGAHAFQTAQDNANPLAYEILGNALQIASKHALNLASAGTQVAQSLGEFSSRIAVDLNAQAGQFTSLLDNMVKDLIGLGQVFGNVGHAVLNFASAMPGLAEVLLGVAVAVTRIILAISQLPGWIITAVLVMEEMYRWGGLVALALARIPAAIALLASAPIRFILAMGEYLRLVAASALLAAANIVKFALATIGTMIPAIGRVLAALQAWIAEMAAALLGVTALELGVAVVAAAGLGALIYFTSRSTDATRQWINAQDSAISKASQLTVLGTIATSLAGGTQRLAQANHDLATATNAVSGATGPAVVANRAYVGEIAAAQNSVNELTAAQQRWHGQLANTLLGAEYLSKAYGVNLVTAMALAQAAGVKLQNGILGNAKAAQIARQQIDAMITGYGALGARGSTLANDFQAMNLAAGLQASKVSQMNQAWDTFLGLSTNLTSSFATLITDAGQITNAIATPGTAFVKFGGRVMTSVNAASYALRGFQGTSAQVWQNYDQALQQAGTFTDNLRIAQTTGAISAKQFTEQVAYAAQQLLPYTQHSQLAVQELSALAQEAGGPATDNYQTLKGWIDRNTTSTGNFNRIMQGELGQLTNVTQAAKAFASTLQSDLIQQLASAGLHFSTVNALINTYAQMVQNGTSTTAAGAGVRAQLISQLQKAGFTAQQAAGLVGQLSSAIGGLQSKTVTITTNFTSTGSVPAGWSGGGGGGAGGSPHQAHVATPGGGQHGGIVVGPPGIDRVPAMLTAGEAVLTKEAVQSLGVGIIHSLNASGGGHPTSFSGGPGSGFIPGGPMIGMGHKAAGYSFAQAATRIYDDVAKGIGMSPAAFGVTLGSILPPRGGSGLPIAGTTPSPVLSSSGGSASSGSEIDRLQLVLKVEVILDGTKIGQANRTDTLIYNRRNPTNALSLRVR